MRPQDSDPRGETSSPRPEAPRDFPPLGAGSAYIAAGLDLSDFALLLDDKVSHLRASAMTPGGVKLSNGVLLRIEPDGLGGGGSGGVASDDYVAEEFEEDRTKPEPEDKGDDEKADEDPAPIRAATTSVSETWPTVEAIRERTLGKLEARAERRGILTPEGDPSPRLLLIEMRADGLDAGDWQGGETGDPAAAFVFVSAGFAALELLAEEAAAGRLDAAPSADFAEDLVEDLGDFEDIARLLRGERIRVGHRWRSLSDIADRYGLDPIEAVSRLQGIAENGKPEGARLPVRPAQSHKAPSAFDHLFKRYGREMALEIGAANPLAVCGRRSRFEDREGERGSLDGPAIKRDPVPDPYGDREGRAGTRSGVDAHSRAAKAAAALALSESDEGSDYWLGVAAALRASACEACGEYQRRQRREARR